MTKSPRAEETGDTKRPDRCGRRPSRFDTFGSHPLSTRLGGRRCPLWGRHYNPICCRVRSASVEYPGRVFTFSGCDGPKAPGRPRRLTALWVSGQTALTWNGGTVVEVSIPTVTQSDDYCPAPPITDINKFLESVVAMSGGGTRPASVCTSNSIGPTACGWTPRSSPALWRR